MKSFFASPLAIVLAAGPIVAASPQDATAPAGPAPLAVAHAPGCMIAGANPQVDAGITPEARATVVEKPEDCKDKPVAAFGPADPVRVFSVAGPPP
jgi:hypothetical protein